MPGRRPPEDYRAALATAVGASPLSRLTEPTRNELLTRGMRFDAPARTVMYREGDAAFSGVVVRGVLRLYVSAADGREFTLLWAHPGDWLGYSLIAGGPTDISAQAVTDVSVHTIPADLLASLARTDADLAWTFARQIAARLRQASGLVQMLAFMDLRQRIAHRLIEVAFHAPPDGALIAHISQQELADAVGSTRTSVARVLAELRREGIVRSVPKGLEVVQPERLVPGLRAVQVA